MRSTASHNFFLPSTVLPLQLLPDRFSHHQQMAAEVVNITGRIIEDLVSLSARGIGLLWGVEDELQSLSKTVSTIKSVLLDAEERQAAGNHAVRDWLEKVKDAICDADDLLDDISTEALRREITTRDKSAKKVRIFFSQSNQIAYRFKIDRKIKAIRERLAAIDEAARGFHFEVRPVETRVEGNRERDTPHYFVRGDAVIGREHDKKAVIHRLVDSNVEENVLILPIVGVGGLGKTTLAQLIFNDEQIQKHFELKMWVRVSDTFYVKNIVEKILESATNEKQPSFEMDTLVNYLLKEIDGKKYFLVLDDVWNQDHEEWSRLKELLIGGARGSRILVTTRHESVAKNIRYESVARIMGTVESYSLKRLDEEASWSLFKQKAFEKGQEPENSSIVALGKEIVQKCSGVPLAITTIGSLLGSKNPETEWLSFKENELSNLSQEEDGIIPTLKLSYDNLPSHLKHCFAYCSLFPKDCKIDRSTLIKLWIAQGFVNSSDQNRSLEEVGNEYFMDLLWRSFFQEAEMDEFGNVIQCKIHDLMHDLAISMAGSVITTLDDKEINIDEKTRHVSIVGYDMDISSAVPTLLYKASKIRTFLRLSSQGFWDEIDCNTIFSSFKLLRVLDLHQIYSLLQSNSSSIGKLKHLRYLDLSGNNVLKKLPHSITRLQNLQTLKLSHCCRLTELPRDIKKLVNLRHLEIDQCPALTCMPRGLGQLTNLQTLSTFVVHSGSGGLQELNALNSLRGELQIENLGHGKSVVLEYEAANLKGKQHLQALHLRWSTEGDANDSDVDDERSFLEGFQPHSNLKRLFLRSYRGSSLPSWLLSLTNLVTFKLSWCKKCQYLPPLSRLPSLKYLVLESLDAMEYISNGDDSNEFSSSSSALVLFFPSLKEIYLDNCPNLKGWWRRSDSSMEVNSDSHNSIEITKHHLLPTFPRLSTLQISDCPMLTFMPMFPHLEGDLLLGNTSSKPLQQTMMMNIAAPQSPTSTATDFSSSTPLSKLKSIELSTIADLETVPLQNLTFLESLKIANCHRLKSLSPDIQNLTALQDLVLFNCCELVLANKEDGMQWQGLTSLLLLRLSRLPKLVSLPSGLQHASTLQKLEISDCESLTAIPEWIHNCKSLQVLEIRGCWSLASLPEEMRWLTSLQRLQIENCPILLRRCERDIGEDWPKIAHIPELDLLVLPQLS
jgi:Leucine-rich repeat (LRR) protein